MQIVHCTDFYSARTKQAWQEPEGSCRDTKLSEAAAAAVWLRGAGGVHSFAAQILAAGILVSWRLWRASLQRAVGIKRSSWRSHGYVLAWWQLPAQEPRSSSGPHTAMQCQPVGLEDRLGSVLCWKPKCPGLESGGWGKEKHPGGVTQRRGAAGRARGCRGCP